MSAALFEVIREMRDDIGDLDLVFTAWSRPWDMCTANMERTDRTYNRKWASARANARRSRGDWPR